jgi:hypothetical protein
MKRAILTAIGVLALAGCGSTTHQESQSTTPTPLTVGNIVSSGRPDVCNGESPHECTEKAKLECAAHAITEQERNLQETACKVAVGGVEHERELEREGEQERERFNKAHE